MGSTPLPPKKEVALALLANSSVFVHLDPRHEGVAVPAWFKKQPQLVLQIGLNMAVPIPDLHLDDEGMSCTLSFNRTLFHCSVPWSSVYAMVDDEGSAMVWPDEVPPEIQAQARAKMAEAPPPKKEAGAKRPRLENVKSDGTSKKKKAEPRARIASVRAVPPAAPSAPGAAPSGTNAAPPAAAPSPVPAPARSATTTSEQLPPDAPKSDGILPDSSGLKEPKPASQGSGARKPKRELPPYLRVVK